MNIYTIYVDTFFTFALEKFALEKHLNVKHVLFISEVCEVSKKICQLKLDGYVHCEWNKKYMSMCNIIWVVTIVRIIREKEYTGNKKYEPRVSTRMLYTCFE